MPLERESVSPVYLNTDPLHAALLSTPHAGGLQAEAGYLRESGFTVSVVCEAAKGARVFRKEPKCHNLGRSMRQSGPGVIVTREVQFHFDIACCIILHVEVQTVQCVPEQVGWKQHACIIHPFIHFKGCHVSVSSLT